MYKPTNYIFLTTLLIASFLMTACGAESAQDPFIATAVAQTVAAQNAGQVNTETPSAPETLATQTPLQFSSTLTPLAPVASPTSPGNVTTSECAKASLVSETIPDGTIYKPGEQFVKVWEIKNLSNCTWDASYKIIFWSGDILGGATYYDLPRVTGPGQTLPVEILLTVPTADETYRSEWKLQTPDGINFGVGTYDAPFYTEVVVSSADEPGYAVTSVEYNIVRTPATGCPFTKITYTVYATFTTNGPLEFTYLWIQKDGNSMGGKGTIKMDAAGTKTVSREWSLRLGNTPGDKWMAMTIISPEYKEYPHAVFTFLCGSS